MSVPVAFVGLGAMGAPMAECLAAAGHPLRLFDVRAEAVAAVAARTHGVAAPSAAEAARGAQLAMVMVATPEQARDVVLAPGGVADGLASGSVVVLLATVGRDAAVELADRLRERGIGLVDAPVSGGVTRAAEGDLLIMCSGSDADVEACRPALEVMARTVARCGARPGDGQAVKLVNQLLCGVHIAAAAEALAYAEALGLDPGFVLDTVREGAAQSFMLEDRGERMVHGTFAPPRSALDIFVKDLGLVCAEADATGFTAPLATSARALFSEGSARGLGRDDDSGVIRVLREGATTAADTAAADAERDAAYRRAGTAGPVPRGSRPAVVVVDFQQGFTDPGQPTGADMTVPVERTAQLLAAARRHGHPVLFTVIAYAEGEADRLAWLAKWPSLGALAEGTPLVELDERLARRPDEPVLTKKGASAFFGTDLADRLAALGVDTVLLCGATTSGCIRASAVDSVQSGFATLVVRDCVADRAQGPHDANLFDIQAKYADVVSAEDAGAYLSAPASEVIV